MPLLNFGRSGRPGTGSDEAPPLRQRLKDAIKAERRFGYWPVVLTLAVLGLLFLLLPGLRPRLRGAIPAEPARPRPGFTVLAREEIPHDRVERMNVVALVRPGVTDDTLRQVLEWALYECLDEFNGRQKRSLQVVWVYALEDSAHTKGMWRAMAVWVDPRLPAGRRPTTADLGGDALSDGSMQYDFTNPGRGGQSP